MSVGHRCDISTFFNTLTTLITLTTLTTPTTLTTYYTKIEKKMSRTTSYTICKKILSRTRPQSTKFANKLSRTLIANKVSGTTICKSSMEGVHEQKYSCPEQQFAKKLSGTIIREKNIIQSDDLQKQSFQEQQIAKRLSQMTIFKTISKNFFCNSWLQKKAVRNDNM